MTALLDIVVLVHDVPQWADLCIRAVEHHTRNPFRLIIVDNASVLPETKALLEDCKRRGHTVIHLAENKSFSNGVNVGVNAGDSKFVCILNDDAIVTEGWDGQLMQDASVKQVGLVGARSNYASGPQGNPAWQGEPPFLVFVCVAMRRQIWEIVGPMDEVTFDGFSSEDLDYSWRVKKAGYELKVSNAYVLHAGSRTLAVTAGDALARQKNDQKYNARLVEKWGKEHVASKLKLRSNGLIVSYHAEEWTRVTFLQNLINLRAGPVGFSYLQVTRAPIHMARQMACDFALDNGFDWIAQFDDDATFPSDVLNQFLNRQKDVVCALAYQRKPPYLPCVYEVGDDGLLGRPLEGIEHTGLRKVDVSGFHCSLMSTSVFKRLREGTKDAEGKVLVPGTRQYFGGFENKVGEDFALSLNLKKLGISIYCDTEVIAGHIGSAVVVDENYKKAFHAGKAP